MEYVRAVKPCPCCGKPANHWYSEHIPANEPRYGVSCSKCTMNVREFSLVEALDAWNKRTSTWLSLKDYPPDYLETMILVQDIRGVTFMALFKNDGEIEILYPKPQGEVTLVSWQSLPE